MDMNIDLEKKSNELKKYVGQFETTMFLGEISFLMSLIRSDNIPSSLKGLNSPQRQLLYIAGLNVSSSITDNVVLRRQYSDKEFEHIKKMLNEIEAGYDQFFYPKEDDVLDEDWIRKREVAMPTFLSYFNQGLLNYEEQILERVIDYFEPFDKEILKEFGLTVSDFVDIYNFIDGVPNAYLMEEINPTRGEESSEEFVGRMWDDKILHPNEWFNHMPSSIRNSFAFVADKGKMYRFEKKLLIDKYGTLKTNSFLDLFSIGRKPSSFLYYTDKNPVHLRPIFEVSENQYQAIEIQRIIQAVYDLLYEFCTSSQNLKERFYKHRGKKLESKIESVFRRFFKDKAHLYNSYYSTDKKEQDLLFLIDGMALIVEAKASKRDEPMRNPEMAFPQIERNFEETIQKGYDQAYRVKSKFIKKRTLKLYSDEKLRNPLFDVRTKNYRNAFSIIVTLERFGQIQTDLFDLLSIYDDDEYPWSVCIDDLEAFLLLMEKVGMKKNKLEEFLLIRQKLQGRIISSDELEICGSFIRGDLNTKSIPANEKEKIIFLPIAANIFDQYYLQKGLGFKNEKNLELKTNRKYYPLGGV